MKKHEIAWISILFFLATSVFFYKTFLHGFIPFPGDLLMSEYSPWKTYSYLGYLPGSYPTKFQYFDTLRQLYPWKTFSISLLKDFQIPLWNPYNFSGSPLLANSQSAVFYPLNILFFILNQAIGWTIFIFLQPFLAAFFTYLYARKIGLSKLSSCVASICFAFSLFMSVFLEYSNIGHTFLWLPFLLFVSECLLKERKIKYSLLFVFSLISSFLAGHIQIFGFVTLFLIVYLFFRIIILQIDGRKKINIVFHFLTLFIISFGISAVQLFPAIELINNSARVNQSYKFLVENLLIQSKQIILFFSPDFFGNPATNSYLLNDSYPGNALYIGLIPLIFVSFSFFRKQSFFSKFYLLSSLILFLLFLRWPFTEFFYKLSIPFVSTGSPTNAIFLLSFSLSILAGYGLDIWFHKIEKKYYYLILSFALIFVSTFLLAKIFNTQFQKNGFYYTLIIFALFVFINFVRIFVNKKIAIILVFLLIVGDLLYFFQKFNPFVRKELVFPNNAIFTFLSSQKGIDRFWGYGSGAIEANFATQYSLFSPDGYDPLYPKIYGEFINASKEGHLLTKFDSSNRSDAVVASGYGAENIYRNIYRQKILNVLGVRYVLDRDNSSNTKFSKDLYEKIYDTDGWQIYENKKVLPRIKLFSFYKTYRDKKEFETTFFSKSFNESETLLLEAGVRLFSLDTSSMGEASLRYYSPNKVSIATKTTGNQLLFLSDVFYPGWVAFVDGKSTPIYKANYAFRSIYIPKGAHEVIFIYRPYSFYLGLKTTIITSIAGFFYIIIFNKKKYAK